jgi:hypothetical protein
MSNQAPLRYNVRRTVYYFGRGFILFIDSSPLKITLVHPYIESESLYLGN